MGESDHERELQLHNYRKRFCVCDKPNDDMQYTLCHNCSNWYHDSCVNLNESDIQQDGDYQCPFCKNAYPCANTKCNKKAVQIFGEFKSKYCSFECTIAFMSDIVVDPLLYEIDVIKSKYYSPVNASNSTIYNKIKSIDIQIDFMTLQLDYYKNQIENWPWDMSQSSSTTCEFSIKYLDQFAEKLPLVIQSPESCCSNKDCRRHAAWMYSLYSQYRIHFQRYLIYLEHFSLKKAQTLQEAIQLKGSIANSIVYHKVEL